MIKEIISPKRLKTFEEYAISLAYSIGYTEAKLETEKDIDCQEYYKRKIRRLKTDFDKAVAYYVCHIKCETRYEGMVRRDDIKEDTRE